MRLLLLCIVIVLASCTTIKDCGVKPTVTVKQEDTKNTANTDTKNKPSSVIENIRENAVPGGQLRCSF
jgi:hypothetical protein